VLPAGTRFISNQMHAAGTVPHAGDDLTVYNNFVSAGFLDAAGLSLLGGRDFTDADRPEHAEVAIINEAAARVFFGADDPIGRRIGRGRRGPADIEVVGLVKNAKYLNVREAPLPTVYFPFRGGSPMTLHVKTRGDPAAALRIVEQELRNLDPRLPLFQIHTMEQRVDDSLRQERFVATLAAILSVLGTVIAAIGLYGVISFSVVQRRREIGIRVAVGAAPRQVLWMIVRRAVVLVAIGIAVGLPLAVGSLRVTSTFLYGVTPLDPAILAAAMVLLTVVALAASLVPARGASRTDAWGALRQD
jgi:predicted permease